MTKFGPLDSGRQHALATVSWWLMKVLWDKFPRSLAKEFPGYTKGTALIEQMNADIKKDYISAGLRRTLDYVEDLCNHYFVETDDLKEFEKNWRTLWWAGATLCLSARNVCPIWAKSPAWNELHDLLVRWMNKQVRLRGEDEAEVGTWKICMPISRAIWR